MTDYGYKLELHTFWAPIQYKRIFIVYILSDKNKLITIIIQQELKKSHIMNVAQTNDYNENNTTRLSFILFCIWYPCFGRRFKYFRELEFKIQFNKHPA